MMQKAARRSGIAARCGGGFRPERHPRLPGARLPEVRPELRRLELALQRPQDAPLQVAQPGDRHVRHVGGGLGATARFQPSSPHVADAEGKLLQILLSGQDELDELLRREELRQFKQRIEVKTGDEIETLADQFNLMSAELDDSYSTLEKKVADRTRELAIMNSIISVAGHSLDIEEILEYGGMIADTPLLMDSVREHLAAHLVPESAAAYGPPLR